MKYLRKFNEKRVPKDERDLILKDNKYVIVAPLTHSASCKYGADAAWCTANLEMDYIWDNRNNVPNVDTILIYIIQRNFNDFDIEKNKRLTYLRQQEDSGDLDPGSDELRELWDLRDDEKAYDYSNIAIAKSKKGITFWDKQNNEIQYITNLYQLPIDEYAIDKIEDYILEHSN